MTDLPKGPFRFARLEGLHYCFERHVRGRWRKEWVFAENQEQANQKVIQLYGYQHTAYLIRRADTKEVIWKQEPKRAQTPKERVNGTDQTG